MLLKASKTTLIFLLCFGFAFLSGCKSMEFGKPKLPKLPSLAFWKKGEDSEIPPPPARHFDPSRFGDGTDTQVAKQAKSIQSDFDQYGMRIENSAKEASDLASKGFKFPKESLEKLESKPMRKPYGLDDLGGDEMLAKAKNKFDLDSASLKNKFEDTKSATSNQLSSAQQDFRSAMNSTANSGSSTKNPLPSDSNSFTSGDNSFAAAPMAKAVDTAKGFGSVSGDSFSPKLNAFDNVKQVSGESVAAVNNALYDAKGRLASAKSNLDTQALSGAGSIKSEFEQRLLAAQKQAETKSEAFKSGTMKATDQLTALANVSPRTQDLVNKPFPKVAADGSFVPQKSARPVDLNANLPSLQSNSTAPLQISKPNALAANSFGVAPVAKNDSVSQMRSEVEEAKRQIAMLKAQVAAAKQSAASAPRAPNQLPGSNPAMAQNTIEGVVLPLDKVNDAFDPRAGKPVANQFSGQPFSPATPQPRTPNNNFNTGGDSNSFYPATPHGGFGSTSNVKPGVGGYPTTPYGGTAGITKPNALVGQVGFNSANEFQNQVSQASADEPDSIYSGPLQANRIDSSVSEVVIPASILSGSSSFTPGSTTPLR